MQAENQWRQRPKTCKDSRGVQKSPSPPPPPPTRALAARCTLDPPPPIRPIDRSHWHAFSGCEWAPLLGLVVKGLPDSGLSAGGSRAKKKKSTNSLGGSEPPDSSRPVRIRRPNCVFGVGRWRNSSGSAAWRARTRKRICRRFAALGSRALGLFGEAGVGVAIFKRAPEGMPGALGRGAGAEKKGKDFALARAARPRVCTRSACPSRQRGPCLTRRRPSASPSPGRRVAARSGSQTGP